MKYLLDTHALIWAVDAPSMVSVNAASAINDPQANLLLSDATLWEIGIKVGLGKLKLSRPFRPWMVDAMADMDLTQVQVSLDIADTQVSLPLHHGDPFDRLLVSTAIVLQIPILSIDSKLDLYGITRIW